MHNLDLFELVRSNVGYLLSYCSSK